MAWPCAFRRRSSAKRCRTSSRPRLLVGSSSTRTRQPTASARAISTSCCAATDSVPTGGVGRDVVRARAAASAARRHLAHPRRDRRGRSASARRRAGCSPSPTGAARATAPGRSSRRRRGARRSGSAAHTGGRRCVIVAGVGRQRAGEDRHQRALAGAVLADQAADLARRDRRDRRRPARRSRRRPCGCPASRSAAA